MQTIDNVAMIAIAKTSPALKYQSPGPGRAEYPARYRGRVPLKVMVAKDLTADFPLSRNGTLCYKDEEYYVWVNSHGAVSAILKNGEKLGLLPSEFDVTEWH